VRTPFAPSPWTRPKVWCAARKCRHRRFDLGACRRRNARPHHERDRRAGGRSRPDQDQAAPRHPPGSPGIRRAVDRSRNAGHRHQGRRPACALRQGRQDRPVRRRRRGQDRSDHGTDQQRRTCPRRLLGVRRCWRAYPRGQRPLPRDDRIRREQGRRRRRLQGSPGLRPDERASGRPRPRCADRPDRGRTLPRPGPGRAVLRGQHLPLHPGRFGSVGASRPYPVGCGLPADTGHRHGPDAGAHHLHHQGLDHLGAGDLRAGRRP
jgi:hypothetical protein